MVITRDNIFSVLCSDYRTQFGIDIVADDTDESGIVKLCGKYNPPFVRAMWVHYLENGGEERWGGWNFENFLTVKRLNQYARKAYEVMHQHDKVVEEPMYFYRCEKCGNEGCMYTRDKRESLQEPCYIESCRGRMISEEEYKRRRIDAHEKSGKKYNFQIRAEAKLRKFVKDKTFPKTQEGDDV